VDARSQRRHRNQSGFAVIASLVPQDQRAPPLQIGKVAKIDPVIGDIGKAFVFIAYVLHFL
jgi:hypothetical protein